VTDRTGLGIVDVAVLETLDRIGAQAERHHMKCARAVAALDANYGLRPDFAYDALCDMARPWVIPVRCVDFHGNLGSFDAPAAGPRYAEARLSHVGMLAVASERGEIGAVPIGLINGNTYCGGIRPPFDPRRVVTALGRLLDDSAVSDHDLTDMVGPPVFPTGCEVAGDLATLVAGEHVTLRLSARLRPAEPPRQGWLIDHFPPGVGARQICERLAGLVTRRSWSADLPELDRRTRITVSMIEDVSTDKDAQLFLQAARGADIDALGRQLLEVHGVTIQLSVELPASLPEILRRWVTTHDRDDLRISLTRLEASLD
jgi:DNA gyrase subunit A